MKKEKRKFSAQFKTKVVLEAIKEKETIQQLALKFEVHSNQITLWKREFLAGADQVFSNKKAEEKANNDLDNEFLYSKIGRLQTEVDFLKKFWANEFGSKKTFDST